MSDPLTKRHAAPSFPCTNAPMPKLGSASSAKPRHPRLLPRRLESSPVATDGDLQRDAREFPTLRRPVDRISVDGSWVIGAFAKSENLRFPLLADFRTEGQVSRATGCTAKGEGVSETRALRHRPRRHHRLSQCVTDRRQSGADGSSKRSTGMESERPELGVH